MVVMTIVPDLPGTEGVAGEGETAQSAAAQLLNKLPDEFAIALVLPTMAELFEKIQYKDYEENTEVHSKDMDPETGFTLTLRYHIRLECGPLGAPLENGATILMDHVEKTADIERDSAISKRVVMAKYRRDYVTWYVDHDGHCHNGHYFNDRKDQAIEDFYRRIKS